MAKPQSSDVLCLGTAVYGIRAVQRQPGWPVLEGAGWVWGGAAFVTPFKLHYLGTRATRCPA